MTINRFDAGPRMSQAVVHNGTVYLAGQVAKGATVKEQTTAILKQIDGLLKSAGTDKTKTSFITMDSTDGSINTVYHFAWKKC